MQILQYLAPSTKQDIIYVNFLSCKFMRLYQPRILGISGVKQGISGVKQGISGVKQGISGVKQGISGVKQGSKF